MPRQSFSIWQLYRSQAMEIFRRLVAYFNTFIEDGFGKFDVIEKLPVEISNVIFGMLDDRSLRFASKVSHTWRTISEYEQRRRHLRGRKLNRIRCQPAKCSASKILTFKVNERNGNVIREDPNQFRRSSRTYIYLKDKRSKVSKAYGRNNRMRF